MRQKVISFKSSFFLFSVIFPTFSLIFFSLIHHFFIVFKHRVRKQSLISRRFQGSPPTHPSELNQELMHNASTWEANSPLVPSNLTPETFQFQIWLAHLSDLVQPILVSDLELEFKGAGKRIWRHLFNGRSYRFFDPLHSLLNRYGYQ